VFGSSDEPASSGWNAWEGGREGGFFHNVLTLTQVRWGDQSDLVSSSATDDPCRMWGLMSAASFDEKRMS
jgi:hypothetical protein